MREERTHGTQLIGWLLNDADAEWEKTKDRKNELEKTDDQIALILLSKASSIYAGNLELAKKYQATGVVEGALFLLWQLQIKILNEEGKEVEIAICHRICRRIAHYVSRRSEISILDGRMMEAFALRTAIYSQIEPQSELEKGYMTQRIKYLIAFMRKSTDMKKIIKTEELGRFNDEYLVKEKSFAREDTELLTNAVCLWTEEIADELVKVFSMVAQMPEKEL